jgi:hypothetical protein
MQICDRCDNKTKASKHIRITANPCEDPTAIVNVTSMESDLCGPCVTELQRNMRDFLNPSKAA